MLSNLRFDEVFDKRQIGKQEMHIEVLSALCSKAHHFVDERKSTGCQRLTWSLVNYQQAKEADPHFEEIYIYLTIIEY